MPISGISSSGANYPILPPQTATPAYSCILMDQLADISNTLASRQESPGVSAYSCVLAGQLADLSKLLTQ